MSLKPTLEENLRRLRRTSIPTILVEGNDDILLLHWIFAKANSDASNLYVCGSRIMLFNIYEEIQ
jgi:hypothetical protein